MAGLRRSDGRIDVAQREPGGEQAEPGDRHQARFLEQGRVQAVIIMADEAEQAENAERHRSEEHTSELQSPCKLVCRLRLETKKLQKQKNPRLHSNPVLN